MSASINWAFRLAVEHSELLVKFVTKGPCSIKAKPKSGGDYEFELAGGIVEATCTESCGRQASDQAVVADDINKPDGNRVGIIGGQPALGSGYQSFLGQANNSQNLAALQQHSVNARSNLTQALGQNQLARSSDNEDGK